jgi:hypothetical protein
MTTTMGHAQRLRHKILVAGGRRQSHLRLSSKYYALTLLIGLQLTKARDGCFPALMFSPDPPFPATKLHQNNTTPRTRHLHFHPNHRIFDPFYLRNLVACLISPSTRDIEDVFLATETAQK